MSHLKWILITIHLMTWITESECDTNQQQSSLYLTTYQLKLSLQYPNPTIQPSQFHGHLTFDFLSPNDNQFVEFTISNLSLNSMKIFNNFDEPIVINYIDVTENEWKVRIVGWFMANQVYKFEIDYFGKINGGFFETKYKDKNGNDRYLLASNPNGEFQKIMPFLTKRPTGSIQLNVNVPFEWTAIFNSIEEGLDLDVNNPRMNIVKFKATPQMSFKNFLLVIGDLSFYEQRSKSGILVRSFIPRDFDDFLEETSKISANCLSSAESYFEQSFDSEKMDHINALGDWSFSGLGISVYPQSNFSIWPGSASSQLLAQKLLICKQTVRSWLNIRADLENSYDLFEALSMMLSYRLVVEFEDKNYSEVVNEEMTRLSDANQISAKITNIDETYTAKELGAILLMVDDALGNQVFDYAISLFIEMIQTQKDGNVFPTLIEAFQQATDYTPICGTTMIRDFFNSWLNQVGSAKLEISLKDGQYLIQQNTCSKRIVPLIVKELGGEKFSTQWLMPSGEICFNGKIINFDARIPYIFNANGRTYTRIQYSDEIHKLFIEDGIWKMKAGAQYVYIRDLNEQVQLKPEKLDNLLDFIGNSFIDTQPNFGSPLFVDETLKLLDFHYKADPQKINDIIKRQIQNVYNSVLWQPNLQTLRNAILSEQLLRRSVINRIGGSRVIAINFYKQFVDKCVPNFECPIFPVEILSAVLCASVIDVESDDARKLLTQMINDLHQKHNVFQYNSMDLILSNAWQCVYEDKN